MKSQTQSVPPTTPSQSQPQQPSQTSSQSHSVPSNSPVDHADANSTALPAVRLPVTSQAHLYMEPNALKLRKALQHKESQQQQPSPQQQQQTSQLPQASTSVASSRIVGPQRPSSPREKTGLQNWPFDYVKNKIVEEMHRTSDDDGTKSNVGNGTKSSGTLSSEESISGGSSSGGGSGAANEQPPTSQPYLSATNYPYPYSALNINSQVPVSAHTAPTITPKPVVDVLEPTPILSAQYEPLSDED